jgi:hypothetical protein
MTQGFSSSLTILFLCDLDGARLRKEDPSIRESMRKRFLLLLVVALLSQSLACLAVTAFFTINGERADEQIEFVVDSFQPRFHLAPAGKQNPVVAREPDLCRHV